MSTVVLLALSLLAPPALAQEGIDYDDVRERVDPIPPQLYPPPLRPDGTPPPEAAELADAPEIVGGAFGAAPSRPRGFAGPPALDSAAPGTFTETPCAADVPPDAGDVTCGYVTVPEQHADPDGPTVHIAVAILAARTSTPAPDGVVLLGGGPGEPIVPFLPFFTADPVRDERDLVLVDQRGVGLSLPDLGCPEIEQPSAFTSDGLLQATAACRDRLAGQGIDLGAYNTLENAADIDLVRHALGYDEWNVDTGSYGSYLSLLLSRDFPGGLRSQSLQSSIPLDTNYVANTVEGIQRALEELYAACAADPSCAAASGDLEGKLDGVMQTLLTTDVFVDITIPTGERISILLAPELVAAVVINSFYFGPAIAELPAVINGLAAGDYQTFADLYLSVPPGGLPDDVPALPEFGNAFGMTLSVACSEQTNRIDRAAFVETIREQSLLVQVDAASNPLWGELALDVCNAWNVPDADPATYQPATGTTVDSLVVNGRFDHVTQPSYGVTVADRLANAQLIEVPNGGHSPLFDPTTGDCGVAISLDFVADPGTAVDASCLDDLDVAWRTALPAVPSARTITDACPPGVVPPAGFTDVSSGNVHADAIDCVAWYEITNGVAPNRYAPARGVTRGQMASFIARTLTTAGAALPADPSDAFGDDDGNTHERSINQLAAIGIVQGTTADTYEPGVLVSRAQMATFLARATEYVLEADLSAPKDYFDDDDGNFHEENINKVAHARIFAGSVSDSGEPVFGVAKRMRRDQMASTLARDLDLLAERGFVVP